jgi:Flp pilus assembly pilin Flp
MKHGVRFLQEEHGQDLVEYALLLALVALAAASRLGMFANHVSGAWEILVSDVQGYLSGM